MGTKEYHAQKSREWYQRTKQNNPDVLTNRRKYTKERRKNTKSFWVQKLGGVCSHCNQEFPDCVYDFHHVDSSQKEVTPSKILHNKYETIEKELSKCILLCSNCHRIEHERLKYDAHSKRNIK